MDGFWMSSMMVKLQVCKKGGQSVSEVCKGVLGQVSCFKRYGGRTPCL